MTLPSYAMSQASFPEMYERHLVGALFRPWAEILIERAGVAAGQRILDVACGTGIVARLARERAGRGARVVGVDISPPMLEVAQRVAPGIEWRQADAAALPFEDQGFDVVFCHQGLQFFPDRSGAMREISRVLADGGRLAVGVWRSVEGNPVLETLQKVAERQLGPIDDARFAFSDAGALRRLIEETGFREVHVEAITGPMHLDDGDVFLRMNAMAFVGMSAAGRSMSEEECARTAEQIAEESTSAVASHMEGRALMFEIGVNVATAGK